MSRQFVPINQQRHDNVATIKLKTDRNLKFEIACYRNKAQSYRKGVEKDVEEVLQIERVFTNVNDGKFAKISDVRLGLGDQIPKSKYMTDEEIERAACTLILKKGTMQLNEMEREAEMEHMLSEIATIVTQKTIHPETRRPIPVTMVHSALKKIGFAPNNRKNTKTQALDAIRQLQASDVLVIERAPMYLRADLGNQAAADDFLAGLTALEGAAVKVLKREPALIDFLMNPSLYRDADALVQKAGAQASLQVLAASVTVDTEGQVDFTMLAPPGSSGGRSGRGTSMRTGSDDEDAGAGGAAKSAGMSKVDQKKAKRAERKKKNQKKGADSDSDDFVDPLKAGAGKGGRAIESDDEDTRPAKGRGKQKKKGKQLPVAVSPSHAPSGGGGGGGAVSDDDSDDGKGRRGKKGKGRKRVEKNDADLTQQRLDRRRQEREERRKEEEEDEVVMNAAMIRKKMAKQRQDAREDAALHADPNFYDSDNYNTEDYDQFYKSDNSMDIDEIRQLRLEREAKEAEERGKLEAEEAEKNRETTRKVTQRKKKVKRNKEGARVSDTESEEEQPMP